MKEEAEKAIVEAYVGLLERLNENSQQKIISTLNAKLKKAKKNKKKSDKLFTGKFVPEKDADTIINEIKKARYFKKKPAL